MIAADGNRLSHIANGQIRTDAQMQLARRLSLLYGALTDVILQHQPDGAAAEEEKEEDEDEEKRGWQGPSAASGMSREAPQEVGEVASRSKTSSQNK